MLFFCFLSHAFLLFFIRRLQFFSFAGKRSKFTMKIKRLDEMSMEIIPEQEEDIWNLYNIISIKDKVSASTSRKFKTDTTTRAKNAERARITVEVTVHELDYDRDSSTLRLKGKMLTNGQFHTLEIEPEKPFTLTKSSWESKALEKLERSCSNPVAHAKKLNAAAALEAQALNDFNKMMRKDVTRTCYGTREVEYAGELLAIGALFITDELFRNPDANMRRKYIDLVESVKGSGGTAIIFSSMHESGKELANKTGIAAILRFPIPELDELDFVTG